MSTRKRLYSLIGCICLFCNLLWSEGPASSANASPLPGPVPKRLLVIVPHPDDESLGSLALMQRTMHGGGSVYIALLTNGDGFRLAASKMTGVEHPGAHEMVQLGLIRQQEELQALHRLGLRDQAVEFLGYPDGSLQKLWSHEHWDKQSPLTALNGHSAVPYPMSFHRGAPYSGQALVEDLERLLATYQPTDVLYPDPHDIHPDHWAASAFTRYVLALHLQESPREWTYLVHFPSYPVPRHYSPNDALKPPSHMQTIGVRWLMLPLSAAQERQKHEAILCHLSQIKVMKDFLESFVRQNEIITTVSVPTLATQTIGQQPLVWLEPYADHNQKKGQTAAADIRKWTLGIGLGSGATVQQKVLQIGLELANPIHSQDECVLTLRQPRTPPSQMTELRVHIQNGQLHVQQTPKLSEAESAALANRVRFHVAHNRLLVTLPAERFPAPSDLLLHAEIKRQKKIMDQTAWQQIRLTPETRYEN